MPSEAPAAHLERLLDVYRSVPPHEQAALQVLSALHSGVARTHVLHSVRRLGVIRDAAKKSLDNDRMLAALQHLGSIGLLGGDPSGSYGYKCEPALARSLLRTMRASGRLGEVVAAVRAARVPLGDADELWIALQARDFTSAAKLLEQLRGGPAGDHPVLPMLRGGFDDDEVKAWPDALLAEVAEAAVAASVLDLEPFEGAYAMLEGAVSAGRDAPSLRQCLAAWRVLRGDVDGAAKCLEGIDSPRARALRGWVALARNDVAEAGKCLADGVPAGGAAPVDALSVLWGVVVLFHQGDFRGAKKLLAATRALPEAWRDAIVKPLDVVARLGLAEIEVSSWDVRELSYDQYGRPSFAGFVRLLALGWATPDAVAKHRDHVARVREALAACGLRWLSSALDGMLARIDKREPEAPDVLLDAMRQTAPWQRALAALDALLAGLVVAPRAKPRAVQAAAPTSRIAWLLTLGAVRVDIQPVEQMRQGEDGWSKGRPVALERLFRADPKLPLTEEDRRVTAHITSSTWRHRGYPETTWSFETAEALDALVGHPCVCLAEAPSVPVELTRSEPTLEFVEGPDEVTLRFSPRLHEEFTYAVARDSPMTLRLVRVPPELVPFIPVIGDGVHVPRARRAEVDRLLPLLFAVVSVRVVQAPPRGA
jgi:hypothetical protein